MSDKRVRRGDLSELVRVVDDRREEVDGLHDRDVVGHAKDPRVIERFVADEDSRIGLSRERRERGGQVTRTHLGRSTRAARELGQAEDVLARVRHIHRCRRLYLTIATASISTSTPRGRPATCTVDRAGRASPITRPYTSFTRGKSAMS